MARTVSDREKKAAASPRPADRPESARSVPETIVRFMELCAKASDAEAVARILVETVTRELAAKRVSLYLPAREGKRLEPFRDSGTAADPALASIPLDSVFVRGLAETSGPARIDELSAGEAMADEREMLRPLLDAGYSHAMALGMSGGLVGALVYGDPVAREAYRASDDDCVRMLGRVAAVMMTNAYSLQSAAASKREIERFLDVKRSCIGNASRELRASVGFLRSNLCSLEGDHAVENIVVGLALGTAARLQSTIDCLLAFNDIGLDGSGLKLESSEVTSIVEDVLREMIPDLEEKQIKTPVDDRAPYRNVLIDRGKIAIVIRNLIDNAVQSVARGGVITITIRVSESAPGEEDGVALGGSSGRFRARVPGGGSWLVTDVKDDGIGIHPATMQALAGFAAVDSSPAAGETEGVETGFLASREIVAAHGGAIFFRSDFGQGAQFSVWLPLDV